MWISGNISNFAHRIHQIPTGTNDLTGYLYESRNYSGISPNYQIEKWNREYNLKYYQFTHNGSYLTGRDFFGTSNASSLGPPPQPIDFFVVGQTLPDLIGLVIDQLNLVSNPSVPNLIISRSLVSNGPYTQIYNVSNNGINFDDTGLSPNTTYYYVLQYVGDNVTYAGNSVYSNEVSDSTAP